MAIRAGIDLVDIDDVRDAVERWSGRYLHRVYTERELTDCTGPHGADPRRLAARFAAKEAALKVLRPGVDAVPWHSIEVCGDPSGAAVLELRGPARDLARRALVRDLTASIGYARTTAYAIVIADVGS
jgi:holo-[acyl-carrier protein] synthase